MRLLLLVLLVCAASASTLEDEVSHEAHTFLKVESRVKLVAKAAVKGEEHKAETEGLIAIRRIRARWLELKERPAICAQKATEAQRDDCVQEYQRDRKRTLAQLRIVNAMEECVHKFHEKTHAAERKNCIKKAAVDYLKLRPVRAAIEQDKEVVKKDVIKAIDSMKVRAPTRKERVAAALKALYKRLSDIEKKEKRCHELESEKHFKECMAPVNDLKKRNTKGRELLRTLAGCDKLKGDKRAACVTKAEDDLLDMVDPGTAAEVPGTVRELDSEVDKAALNLQLKAETLEQDMAKCNSGSCRRNIRRQLASIRTELQGLEGRFSPRRVCLLKRTESRAKEFRARAKEHAELTELHDAAGNCADAHCTAKEEQKQKSLERAIVKRRALFQAEWVKLRCPFVEPSAAVSKAAAAQAGKATPTVARDLTTLSAMRQRLVELYATLDGCDTGDCKARTRKDINDLTELVHLLSNVEARTLAQKRRDHSDRASLHRKLTKYYLLAADCRTHSCRQEFRVKLRQLTGALAKLDRDELGRVAESVRNMNKYYTMLRRALKKCPSSALGHGCRQMVTHAFRAGTELRQKALLQYLRETAVSNTKLEVAKCREQKKDQKKCAEKAEHQLAERLAVLKIREMRMEKRRALRLCELTANPAKCSSDVNKEFSRDKTVAAKSADKDAHKVVDGASKNADSKALDAKALSQVSRKSGAAIMTVSIAVLCIAMLALLF